VICSLVIKCLRCQRKDSFISRAPRITVRSLAAAAGWRDSGKGWICGLCRKHEDDPREAIGSDSRGGSVLFHDCAGGVNSPMVVPETCSEVSTLKVKVL
jgi:hypothetical protein